MLLFQLDEKRWAELPGPERDQLMSGCDRYAQEMVASGHARHCAVLHLSSTATTLRLPEGRRVITDGPFAETKEVLAGIQVVECRDLDEAIEIAWRFPPLRAGGSVEVRPIRAEGGPPGQP
ncbi:MAG TPA: YciI family protein [Opitutaceae bacterium]|nr:YciI family protein [Opitutaceae bacterium]